jgi:TonB family protein
MKSATTATPSYGRARGKWLVWLASGALASAAIAQSEPNVEEPLPVASDAADPAVAESAETEALELAAPSLDPIARNEQLVASTLAEFGAKSLQTAEAYMELADAQRQAKQHEKAAENYLLAVESYRAFDGPFTPLAIAPLTSLGDNYHEANDDANAVTAYTEARTVSRRAYGLHNAEQIALLDRMSQSLLDLNQPLEAEEQQIEALRLVQRSHPPASEEVLEAIYKYAAWLGARGRYQLERDQYERARRVIRDAYGDEDLRHVRPLLGIGNTYRQERNPAGLGISSLQDALAILLEQPQRDNVAIATTLRDIGDWAVAFGKTGYQGTEYQRAWQLLEEAPNGKELQREWFTGANYVLYEPISPRSLSLDPDAPSGFVTVRFDLDTSGSSQNVTLVESNPAGLKDEAVLRHIRRSRFRPLIANGEIVPGKGLGIQVTFRYLPEGADGDNDGDAD